MNYLVLIYNRNLISVCLDARKTSVEKIFQVNNSQIYFYKDYIIRVYNICGVCSPTRLNNNYDSNFKYYIATSKSDLIKFMSLFGIELYPVL